MPKLVDLDQIKTMLRVTNSHIPSILDLVHVKSGTVHYLTNPMLPSKVEGVGIFTASSDYMAGDTIQINGVQFAVKTMNGTTPPMGMFKSGATVVVGINYQSKSITFKVDGGVGGVDAAGLKLATASVGDVLSGKTFYSGDNSLKTGTLRNIGLFTTDTVTTKAEKTVTVQLGFTAFFVGVFYGTKTTAPFKLFYPVEVWDESWTNWVGTSSTARNATATKTSISFYGGGYGLNDWDWMYFAAAQK